ncbi:MAG: 1-deoxy-D-xylulose-5-phosphate synthase, partial [Clostridium sp.]|uniref:1-deoxy-D-xylulose-5-phosphate synthase n=1 Tax=Clostridium sp. TaxID=1506 RepID=UPI003F36EC12
MDYKVLNKVNSPEDVKKLNKDELNILASEIRDALIKNVSYTGGHFGPNLGVVEMTIALHYVFNSPIDKIVYDISHQSYVHKMLTGRKNAYINKEDFKSLKGYTSQYESEHDFFTIGHTSTSVSLACGLAKARDVKDEKGNIIALIGDGSLSGGEAFEGLNNAAASNKNIIVLVNDNDMSIAENYGGMYKNLKLLRDTEGKAENNFFKAMGFDEYHFVKDGHDIQSLIETFNKVKDTDHPVVIHVHTTKGKGYKDAEENRENFHYVMPFNLETKKLLMEMPKETYASLAGNLLLEKGRKDKTVVTLTAGTPGFIGLVPFREELKEQYIDVGIAEEHAIACASAMAFAGAKPVASFASTFIQRTYDQMSHDLAINDNPALVLVYNGGITGADVTHHGIFDIPLISNIPNVVYLAPTCKEEFLKMMDWGIEQKGHPVFIKVPVGAVRNYDFNVQEDYSDLNKFQMIKKGSKVAVIGLGSFFKLGEEVIEKLKSELNIDGTLINPRYITGIDKDMLEDLTKDHDVVITLEDGILDGGFGEKITRFYGDKEMKVLNYGATKEFT